MLDDYAKVIPYTPREWSRMRMLFLSDELEELEECTMMLSMWSARMGTAIPVAVSCTEQLLLVAFREAEVRACHPDEQLERLTSLKMQHCIALIRFVNYCNEIVQLRAHGQMSIARAVSTLGIPSWVVEIRHSAAHSHVPPLSRLRKAFKFCRHWLWDNFWKMSPDEAMRECTVEEAKRKEDKELEQRVERARMCLVDYVRDHEQTNEPRERTLRAITQFIHKDPYIFIDVLISDGQMINTKKQCDDRYPRNHTDFREIPPVIQILWKNILSILYDLRLTGEFLVRLLDRLIQDNVLEREIEGQIVGWSRMVLETHLDEGVNVFTDTELLRILHRVLEVSDLFSKKILELVIDRSPALSQKRQRELRRVMKMSGIRPVSTADDSMTVLTVADLQAAIKRDQDAYVEKRNGSKFWQETADDDWVGTPLGLLPGQDVDDLSLVINDDVGPPPAKRQRQSHTLEMLTVVEEDQEAACL